MLFDLRIYATPLDARGGFSCFSEQPAPFGLAARWPGNKFPNKPTSWLASAATAASQAAPASEQPWNGPVFIKRGFYIASSRMALRHHNFLTRSSDFDYKGRRDVTHHDRRHAATVAA